MHEAKELTWNQQIEYQRIVAEIATAFVADTLHTGLELTLRNLSSFLGADRSYLLLIADGDKVYATHEWRAHGVAPVTHGLEGVRLNISQILQGSMAFQANKAFPYRAEVKSVLSIPLYCGEELRGLIGFDYLYCKPSVRANGIEMLKTAGKLIITALKRKELENRLRRNEARMGAVIAAIPDLMLRISPEGLILEAYASQDFPVLGEYNNKRLEEILPEEIVGKYAEAIQAAFTSNEVQRIEYLVQVKGEAMYRECRLVQCEQNAVLAIIRDITVNKKAEADLRYLSIHDPLTGLYNRSFFEIQSSRINTAAASSVGLLICDIDGLKIINDTLGHDAGDKLLCLAAQIIGKAVGDNYVVSRVGGDEFAVIMPDCTLKQLKRVRDQIDRLSARHNTRQDELPVNISAGFSFSQKAPFDIRELFKEADNNMYREKLFRSSSTRNSIVQTVMKMLEVRDFITEGHSLRLEAMVSVIGKQFELTGRQLSDLQLLAQFHDLGKVGVSDTLLFKPGPLTEEEMQQMRRHSEIGYRIALVSQELSPIADLILKHHENWDGSGYPLGLKGEDIPIECRMLAIADAYDAMTNDRPYRKGMTIEKAVAELKRCAGTQFDPFLVERFIEHIEDYTSCNAK